MIVRVVEEIALDAPGLVVDLLPHGARLDVDFPSVELEWTEAGLGRTCAGGTIVGRRCGPGIAFAVENFFAIEGNGEVVDVVHELVDLALAEIELLESLIHIGIVVFGDDQGGFGEEQDARLAGDHVAVILRGNGERKNALTDAVDVNLHDNGLFFLLVLVIFVFVFVLVGGSGLVCGLALWLRFVLGLI